MRIGATSVCIISTMLTMNVALSAQGGANDKIRTEIEAFFDHYYEWFSAGRDDLLLEHAYQAPFVDSSPTGSRVRLSRQDGKMFLDELRSLLAADGYARSEMPNPAICVLNSSAAIVSGRGARYRKDGSVMGEYGWTYTVVRNGDGWRIVAVIGGSPASVVRCSN